jgi:hypothetical protein
MTNAVNGNVESVQLDVQTQETIKNTEDGKTQNVAKPVVAANAQPTQQPQALETKVVTPMTVADKKEAVTVDANVLADAIAKALVRQEVVVQPKVAPAVQAAPVAQPAKPAAKVSKHHTLKTVNQANKDRLGEAKKNGASKADIKALQKAADKSHAALKKHNSKHKH